MSKSSRVAKERAQEDEQRKALLTRVEDKGVSHVVQAVRLEPLPQGTPIAVLVGRSEGQAQSPVVPPEPVKLAAELSLPLRRRR